MDKSGDHFELICHVIQDESQSDRFTAWTVREGASTDSLRVGEVLFAFWPAFRASSKRRSIIRCFVIWLGRPQKRLASELVPCSESASSRGPLWEDAFQQWNCSIERSKFSKASQAFASIAKIKIQLNSFKSPKRCGFRLFTETCQCLDTLRWRTLCRLLRQTLSKSGSHFERARNLSNRDLVDCTKTICKFVRQLLSEKFLTQKICDLYWSILSSLAANSRVELIKAFGCVKCARSSLRLFCTFRPQRSRSSIGDHLVAILDTTVLSNELGIAFWMPFNFKFQKFEAKRMDWLQMTDQVSRFGSGTIASLKILLEQPRNSSQSVTTWRSACKGMFETGPQSSSTACPAGLDDRPDCI